jgi:hypothetical protein
MMDDEALNREVDGENSPEESAHLRQELGRRPELRARYEQLLGLVRMLKALRPAEPPQELVREIMRAVRAKALLALRRPRFAEAVRAALTRRPALGLGAALAAGLVLGAFLAGVGDAIRFDEGSGGTMLPASRLGPREIDRAVLAGESFRAEVVVHEAPGWIEVRFRLEGAPPLELSAAFDPEELEPLGFDRRAGSAGRIVLGPGSMQVLEAGAGSYVLRLAVRPPASSAAVRVRLGSGAASVERVLKVAEAP